MRISRFRTVFLPNCRLHCGVQLFFASAFDWPVRLTHCAHELERSIEKRRVLFSWNSDYQKCMKGGKSSHRSSFFLEGLGIIVCRPERKATLRYCILFGGSMQKRRAYIGLDITIGASSLRCVVRRKQRHAFSMMKAAV